MLDTYVELLKKGEVVAFPTETVYGLGADAWNPDAIQKVFDIKGRPSDNPLIVHVAGIQDVADLVTEITEDAQKLMRDFWPGPLTLILPKRPEVLDIITAGLDTVAVRWPKHPLSQELIALTGPLVAPSANSSGKPSPTKAEHVKEDFGDDFPVIEAGETDIGLESTVLDISKEPYQIYRPGAVSAKDIALVIGKEITTATSTSSQDTAAKSPGTKYSHYTPEAEVRWLEGDSQNSPASLYLLHTKQSDESGGHIVHYHGDFQRMAHELYDRFRLADHQGFKTVWIEPFTKKQHRKSLVEALQNRITKAIG